MNASGTAQPILAMQSSVSPLHGALSSGASIPIDSAHSSLIAGEAMCVSDGMRTVGAVANAASWAKRPDIAPRSIRRDNQRFTKSFVVSRSPRVNSQQDDVSYNERNM